MGIVLRGVALRVLSAKMRTCVYMHAVANDSTYLNIKLILSRDILLD